MRFDDIQRIGSTIRPVAPRQPESQKVNPNQPGQNQPAKPDFQQVFKKALAGNTGIRFSRHVQERIQQRQVRLDEAQMHNLQSAIHLAREKGMKDSLVITKEAAFIINVPSMTVVTALQRQALGQRVFTNIDGAIISE